MKKVFFLLLLVSVFSCSKNKPSTYNEMKSDKLLSGSFNNNELQNLAKIVDFFEEQICWDKNKTKEQCYFEFNKTVNNSGNIYSFLNYKKQENLYNKIDSTFINEIWTKPMIGVNISVSKFKKAKYYSLNHSGKYFRFLKDLGEKERYYYSYYEGLYVANEISLHGFIHGLTNTKQLKFKDIKLRLIYSVQYLTSFEISQFH